MEALPSTTSVCDIQCRPRKGRLPCARVWCGTHHSRGTGMRSHWYVLQSVEQTVHTVAYSAVCCTLATSAVCDTMSLTRCVIVSGCSGCDTRPFQVRACASITWMCTPCASCQLDCGRIRRVRFTEGSGRPTQWTRRPVRQSRDGCLPQRGLPQRTRAPCHFPW